jgi:hypothetical protein
LAAAWQAIQELIQILQGIPAGTIASNHIGATRPGATADLPAVVVAVTEVQESLAGIGGLVGTRKLSDTQWSSTSGSWASGRFSLEVWAKDEAKATAVADALFGALSGPVDTLAIAGFIRLATTSVGPIQQAVVGATGSTTALMLPIGCSFVFEAVAPEEIGPDGIIKQVHVEMTDTFDEVMDLP